MEQFHKIYFSIGGDGVLAKPIYFNFVVHQTVSEIDFWRRDWKLGLRFPYNLPIS